ncbi:MAG: hypothetical protein HY313_01540 [Acidobacteria bacterium]|nr:hypothetical protein [Acidobacteriota bacterium]
MRLRLVFISIVLCSCFVYPIIAYSSAQEPREENSEKTAETVSRKEPPKAQSQEELEAYQKFIQAQDLDERIRGVEDFLLQYPESALKEYAYQAAAQAYQAKNDYERVLTYGELTLTENQDNLVALLILASSIADRTGKNTPDRDEKLNEAGQYAKRALARLPGLERPTGIEESRWEQTKREAEVTAHTAIGMIAMVREDFAKAESELRLATSWAVPPDPVLLYRLGLCYSFQQRYDSALQVLKQAEALGGVKVPDSEGKTKDLVAEAIEFALRGKNGGAAPPVAASQPPGAEPSIP